MNFLTIINNEIEEEKIKGIPFYTPLSELATLKKQDYFKKLHEDNIEKYILNTFLFQKQYNKLIFSSLKEQFLYSIINNNQKILDIYKSTPIEIILTGYFHYITQSINQKQLFNFIQVIISHNNAIDFLKKFTFVSDYDMHLLVISFIESKNPKMLSKNKSSNFYEQFITYLKEYKEKKQIVKIFTNIFYSYIDNKMFLSAKLFKEQFFHNFCPIEIKNTLDLMKNENICNEDLSIFSILSDFKNYYFSDHLNLIYESLKTDYFSDCINFKDWFNLEKHFKFNKPDKDLLKNNLYLIYKNILFKKMISNKNLNIIELNLLMQIYCISNSLFSFEEQNIILCYLKNSLLFNDIILENSNLFIVFLFFSFYNNFNYFEYIIKDNQDIINSIITINYEYLNKDAYNILIKYSNLDVISNLFKSFLNKKFKVEFLVSKEMVKHAKKRHLYYFANQTFDINLDLFNSLIDEENKVIFEEIYMKKTIANF